MISYKDYLNLLRDKNILLYDFQKRISYYRFQNLLESSNQIEQKGGGNNNINSNNSNKILSLEKHNLEKLITLLNYKDFEMAKKILDNFS
jgi:hypothetical protein